LTRLRGRSRFGAAKARPSTSFSQVAREDVDARLKAGHDEFNLWTPVVRSTVHM
jgi:hypothetical protein